MKIKRNALLVINPFAGKSSYKSRLAYLEEKLGEAQLKFGHFFTEHDGKGKLARHLESNRNFSEIIVMGGDGTLNYAINELLGCQLPMSIVSNGTGNDSVKSLHGERNFEKQVEIAIHGVTQSFDLGLCNGRAFVNGLGIGFDGLVVEKMSKRKKKQGGHLDYLLTVLKTVAGFREKDLSFTLDGKKFTRKILLMTVSNGTTFGGGFVINPHARSNDGMLDVCVLKEISPLARFWHLPKLKTGSHDALQACEFYKARNVLIAPSNELVAHLDGEYFGHPPFDISILPKAIQVRC
jgi:YegS/Rv2252/BmrU family lipid kinase